MHKETGIEKFNSEISIFLNNLVTQNATKIREWIENEYAGRKRLLYSSVDMRNAGFKVAHVDTNLFPAGFNNIKGQNFKRGQDAIKAYLDTYYPSIQKVLIVPENFTRNLNYLQNIVCLSQLFIANGYDVRFGSSEAGAETIELTEPENIRINSLKVQNKTLYTADLWCPDLIVLNNDLVSGVPPMLQDISQPIIPDVNLGWYKRRKHEHFAVYDAIAYKFAEEFGFDPWFISTFTQKCGEIDFRNKSGLECIAQHIDKILYKVQQKYNKYNINSEPYAFVKADNGTFGVGIMTAKSGEELLAINKKKRHSMNTIKHGIQNTEVMIQEGVPTILSHQGYPAEHMIYLINGQIIGMIQRINTSGNIFSNLNSKDMQLLEKESFCYNIEAVVGELATLAVHDEKYE